MKNTKVLLVLSYVFGAVFIVGAKISLFLEIFAGSEDSLILSIVLPVFFLSFCACWFMFAKRTAEEHPVRYKVTKAIYIVAAVILVVTLLIGGELKIGSRNLGSFYDWIGV